MTENIVQYNIYHSASPGVTKATGTKIADVTSPHVIPGLTNGVPHYFVVTMENAYGESDVSAEVEGTPGAPMQGILIVVDSTGDRIMKRSAADLSYIAKVGVDGNYTYFQNPYGVSIYGDYVYIADADNQRIVKRLLSDLSLVATQTTVGAGEYANSWPAHVDCDGVYLYISMYGDVHRIEKWLASDLSFVSRIGTWGTGDDQFKWVEQITHDATHLYIADSSNYRIVKRLKSDLSFVSKIGSSGSGNDQFNSPMGITNDGTYLYISDTYNARIQRRLMSNLSYVSKFSSDAGGTFVRPREIATDGTYVWFADPNYFYILKYTVNGAYISKVGSYGVGNDQFKSPVGMAII